MEARGRLILVNAFSPSMLQLPPGAAANVCIKRLRIEDLARIVEIADDCAIGHKSTVDLVEAITGKKIAIPCARKMITIEPGDTVIVVSLTFRPPEGKVYTYEELINLFNEGKIAVWAVSFYPC